MRDLSEYRRRKAESISHAIERTHWLELAEDWIALSQIPFYRISEGQDQPAPHIGSWRGELRRDAN